MLPIFLTDNTQLVMMQNQWSSQLNPILRNALNQGLLLQNVQLVNGANVINHKLGRNLVGWFITRQRSAATLYDTQDTNQMPNLTLNLTSSAMVSVDIYVF